MRRGFLTLLLAMAAATSSALTAASNTVWTDFHWSAPETTGQLSTVCDELVAKRNFSQALALLDELRAQNPADPAPQHQSALLFWISGDREEASRRFLIAFRSPGAQRTSAWALAAMSAQARSYPECVGWIKQAAKDLSPVEIASQLQQTYFSDLCNYPPYRELLTAWGLRDICPQDIPIAIPAFRPAVEEKLDFSELLDKPSPSGNLKLSVEEDKPALNVRISPEEDRTNK